MRKRNILNSPGLMELKRRRRKIFLNKILISIFSLIVIFAGLAYISRISVLNIKDTEVAGNKVIDAEAIKSAVSRVTSGNYLWLFPRTNILFYPQSNIKVALIEEFKRLENVDLSIKNYKILKVSVTEREGVYTWCGDVPSESNNESKCYFMDKSGYIFDEAPFFSGDVYFKFYGKLDLKDDSPLGANFSPENFSKLVSFKKSLEDIGLKPEVLYTNDDGSIRIFLPIQKGSREPYIVLDADDDFQTSAENLELALSTEPLLSDFKNKYSSLEYIDLRYGNKVYYRFSAQGGSASGGR